MKNIIILLRGLYSKRDQKLYGVDILKRNFSVNIIDCTAWLNKEFWNIYSEKVYKSEEHVVIRCKEDFLSFISEIKNPIVIDSLPNNPKTHWIRKTLKEKSS